MQLRERETETAELQNRLGESRQQLSDAEARLRAAQGELAALQHKCTSQNAEHEASLTSLQRQLQVKADECAHVNSQLADCERRVAELRAQLQTLQSAQRQSAESVESLKADLQRAQQQSHALTNQVLLRFALCFQCSFSPTRLFTCINTLLLFVNIELDH